MTTYLHNEYRSVGDVQPGAKDQTAGAGAQHMTPESTVGASTISAGSEERASREVVAPSDRNDGTEFAVMTPEFAAAEFGSTADPESAWVDLPSEYGRQRKLRAAEAATLLGDPGAEATLSEPEWGFIKDAWNTVSGAVSDTIDAIAKATGYVVEATGKVGVFIVKEGVNAGLEVVKDAVSGKIVPMVLSAVGGPGAVATYAALSPALRGAFDKWVRKNEKKGIKLDKRKLNKAVDMLDSMESAPESSALGELQLELMLDRAIGDMEVVIGEDDRVPVTMTTDAPWRRICALRITFPTGRQYRGTGFFIGPRTVATAGHCVHLMSQGGWASSVEVIPGADGASAPYGRVVGTDLRSVVGWVDDRRPADDYAAIILPEGSFENAGIGAFGFAALDRDDLVNAHVVVSGYPGDKPFAEAWTAGRALLDVQRDTLHYDIDTAGGQSGAGVYANVDGQRCVVGIHNYGADTSNTATRITPARYRRLEAWSNIR